MATPIKCTAFFGSDAGKGWSESHYIEGGTPVGSLLPFFHNFKLLIDSKRVPLLASDCYVKGLRVSYETEDGDIASSPFRYTPYQRPANNKNGSAPAIAAKVRFGESTNTQFSDTYLRGFWDNVEHDEQLDFTSLDGAAWLGFLNQYTGDLVQKGYGWFAQTNTLTRRGTITTYTKDAQGFVTYTLVKDSGPAMPGAGAKRQFRAARLNHSTSILNVQQVVEVVDATHVKTINPRAALDFDSAGTWVMPGWAFTAYTGVQYTILARKPMGAPFLDTPGRAKARNVG